MLPIRFKRTVKNGQTVSVPPARLPGGFYERLFKGDFEGHPFRGNQYTDVAGSSGSEEFKAVREKLAPFVDKPIPKTNVKTLDEALALAASDAAEFQRVLEDFAAQTGGTVRYPPPSSGGVLKSRKAAAEKLERKSVQPRDLSDLVRATIEYPSVEDVYAAASASIDTYGDKMLQVDDKIARPTPMGYIDVSLKVLNPNGSVGEILMNTPEILAVKGADGHRHYEEGREIEAALDSGAEVTERDILVLDDAYRRSNRLYGEAIKEGRENRKKSDSNIGLFYELWYNTGRKEI